MKRLSIVLVLLVLLCATGAAQFTTQKLSAREDTVTTSWAGWGLLSLTKQYPAMKLVNLSATKSVYFTIRTPDTAAVDANGSGRFFTLPALESFTFEYVGFDTLWVKADSSAMLRVYRW